MDEQIKILDNSHFPKVSYYDSGEGSPVMLVHGFPVDGTLWEGVAAGLKKRCRLLIPDLPGSGLSPLADNITMESMADILFAILEQEKIDHCVLIGHSMGGYITLAFAEKYADQLLGFGLFHSTAFADTEEKKAGRLRSVEFMKQYGAGKFLRQMMPTLFSADYRKSNTAEMQTIIKSKEKADVNALMAYYGAMMKRPDRIHVLKQTKVPVLFVIGKEDTAVPENDVLKQVYLPVVSDTHILNHVAHLGMLEKPNASVSILKDFIQLCQDMNKIKPVKL